MPGIHLTEIARDTYGRDGRAINRHSERTYRDEQGNLFMLSCTLDGIPPFFEAYGPYRENHRGLFPGPHRNRRQAASRGHHPLLPRRRITPFRA